MLSFFNLLFSIIYGIFKNINNLGPLNKVRKLILWREIPDRNVVRMLFTN